MNFFPNHPKSYNINKTDVYQKDDTWNLDELDLKDYEPENNRCYRYVLIVIKIFSKFGWTVSLKNRNMYILYEI